MSARSHLESRKDLVVENGAMYPTWMLKVQVWERYVIDD